MGSLQLLKQKKSELQIYCNSGFGFNSSCLCDTVKVVEMAMPQRDETIEEIKRLDALLEYAVMHDDEAEAARIRAELTKLVEKV